MSDGFQIMRQSIVISMSGLIAKTMCVAGSQLEETAYHEGAHVVLMLHYGRHLAGARIGADGGLVDVDEGRLQLSLGEALAGSKSDEERIADDARALEVCGQPADLGELEQQTIELVRDRWHTISRIAQQLLLRRVLNGRELEDLYGA